MKMEHRSTNILFGDVKGYSRLSNEQLKKYAGECLPAAAKRISDYNFDHINTWGDGIFISSGSIFDLAGMALELRDFFRNFDWEKYSLPNLDVRLSIHHGEYFRGSDPFTGGGLLAGQTIIRAARMEPVVLPGQIWMTDAAAIALRDMNASRASALYFADPVGRVLLAKGAGEVEIFALRRNSDPELSENQRNEILATSNARADGERTAPPFEVCVGVVVRGNEVLLVRRQRDASGLNWMFPSGKKVSVEDEAYVIRKEVFQETGISCVFRGKIATVQSHPITGACCHFFHLEPLDQKDPVNTDPEENAEVRYVPISNLSKLIEKGLTEEVLVFLSEHVGGKPPNGVG